jgi:lipopolysaccharide biosynthesis protein
LKALADIEYNTRPGRDYRSDDANASVVNGSPVRLIAYYLPQFHPIAENDRWWGKGFTEWTNVTKALPRFAGHYQPQLPGELGFYDLRLPETLRDQAALARRYGVHGFCFHHYWFQGRSLLDTPINLLLSQPDIELPFCVNWANENWTRRWSGHDDDILIGQNYSPEDDLAFAASLVPLFRDRRYIQVHGRPLLMIYRPSLFPDALATVSRWRSYFREAGMPNPYIVMAQTYGDFDPRKYGMDAAAGFPPHNGGFDAPRVPVDRYDAKRQGQAIKYDDMLANTLANRPSAFTLFPGVCPAWDNEARRPGDGVCFVGSTPAKYAQWLRAACNMAINAAAPSEKLVFINAWNEWAEGAHLEPDQHYGYAYLAETLRVIRSLSSEHPIATTLDSLPISEYSISGLFRRILRRAVGKCASVAEATAWALRRLL